MLSVRPSALTIQVSFSWRDLGPHSLFLLWGPRSPINILRLKNAPFVNRRLSRTRQKGRWSEGKPAKQPREEAVILSNVNTEATETAPTAERNISDVRRRQCGLDYSKKIIKLLAPVKKNYLITYKKDKVTVENILFPAHNVQETKILFNSDQMNSN